MRNSVTKTAKYIFNGCILILATSLVIGAILGQPLGLAFVETGSMQPTLEPGDGFVAVPTQLTGQIEQGDVVTFRAKELHQGELTTHRVVGETTSGYITRGDYNPVTDQDAGEPPVERSQIVAVALQIRGQVVVIPNLESIVTESQGVLSKVAGVIGLDSEPGQLATVLFVILMSILLLDEILEESDQQRVRERTRARSAGVDTTKILSVGIILVVIIATLSMALTSGATTIAYDSVSATETTSGGIPAGSEQEVPIKLSNAGLMPMIVFVETSDGAAATSDSLVLSPRSESTVNISVTAPTEPGQYEQRITQYRYLGILPVSVLRTLQSFHPWVAIFAVNSVISIVLYLLGRLLLGNGRLRIRPGRKKPVGHTVVRAVRDFYK